MSISCIFGSPVLLVPNSSSKSFIQRVSVNGETISNPIAAGLNGGGLAIECSSRPKKKATAHHMKTRPRKSQPWDIRRKPTIYAPLPPLPPDWTLVSSSSSAGDGDGDGDVDAANEAALPSTPALQAPVTSG